MTKMTPAWLLNKLNQTSPTGSTLWQLKGQDSLLPALASITVKHIFPVTQPGCVLARSRKQRKRITQPLKISLWPMAVLGYIKPTCKIWAHLLTFVLLVLNQGKFTGISLKVMETHPNSSHARNPASAFFQYYWN